MMTRDHFEDKDKAAKINILMDTTSNYQDISIHLFAKKNFIIVNPSKNLDISEKYFIEEKECFSFVTFII